MTSETNWSDEIGKPAADAIVEMVAALECDYERLAELRDLESGKHLDASEIEDLAELEVDAGECENEEQARERIREDALSVEVRSGWMNCGDEMIAEEFCILLTTGGPAVRIRGELDQYKEPSRAWLEVQDWGKPWTRYYDIEQYTLLAYARCFYFGE